jgi:hypothetical protein
MTRAWLSLRCLCSSVHSPLSSNTFKEGLILLETSMSKLVTSFPERRDEHFIVYCGCPFQNGWVLAAKSPCSVIVTFGRSVTADKEEGGTTLQIPHRLAPNIIVISLLAWLESKYSIETLLLFAKIICNFYPLES